MPRLLSLKSLSLVLVGVVLVAAPISMAIAADKTPVDNKGADTPKIVATSPDPMQNPALANMLKMGVKLYYLGTRSNMEGWLIMKDGQLQMVYIPVGSTDLILGAMFDRDGKNVTSDQVDDLVKTNPQVAQDMANGSAAKQQTAGAGAADSPGEKLLHQMDNAYGVFIGDAAAPTVDMVMDANCKHCQASWKVLRDAVMAKKLRLRLIPIANPGSDNERAGGILLHIADPLKAWDKYVAGDGSALPGTPDQAAISSLRSNHALIDNWNIDETPYFVYRSKAGSVKIIRGEIKADHLNDLLTDITP